MKNMLKTMFAYIGSFGPLVLFLVIATAIFLKDVNMTGIILLLAWMPIGMTLKSILKWIINEPRPKGSIHLNNWERYLDKGTNGMPSGHAHFVGSELAMTICMKLPVWLQVYSGFQSAITMWQRYAYKKHTISQLCVGFFVGVMYSIFYCSFLKCNIN